MTAALKVFRSAQLQERGVEFKTPRDSDAGFDLPSLEDVIIAPGGFALLRTGLHFAVPHGYLALVRDRSSIALRGGVVSAGVIDSSYRGEVKVAMHNFGTEPLQFHCGDRIAQCIVFLHLLGSQCLEVESLEALGDTDRGSGGFGSTGR